MKSLHSAIVPEFRMSFTCSLTGKSDGTGSWYSPRQGADRTVREFAFNHRYKLYRSGQFFDLAKDLEEQAPQKVNELKGEATAAARSLQAALDQFTEVNSRQANGHPEIKSGDDLD